MAYAEGTSVSIEKTQADIAAVLRKYGAEQFMQAWNDKSAVIGFVAHERQVRFVLASVRESDDRFARDGRGYVRPPKARQSAADAENRRRWRALLLTIKAKLEAVESGIALFEEEFLANIVMPDGQTVAEHVMPVVGEAYRTRIMPTNLLAIGAGRG